MKTLSIDSAEMVMALQNHSGQARCFLDLETGEVIIAPDDLNMLPEDDIAHIAIADESGRFREIDGLDSHRSFQIMAEFVETQVTSHNAIRQLQTALGGKSPFRRFKDTLFGYPAIRDEWFKYEQQAYLAEADSWLKRIGIKANWVG